ncbi:aminoglycoside phosphotransferase family protein [Jeotgalibacillus sp. ET6]|uniref:aminoglycoside phosphotransferase family protein n=1 Tax=Jeotgalibacillus sp. ET6 TaxID=3037260 RepID=UPI0024188DFF|nr:aminoglycoside phosphotransferase family protein [Jeotgalibacillus sp. ET6]MDG5472138.1 aminoglycoside phosphotransferase family protein [Jeotgalibacillus sp. ET6]
MELHPEFLKAVRLYAKEKGENWLAELPVLIQYAEEKWELDVKEPYVLSINYVAPAVTKDGTKVVVKLCMPDHDGFKDELNALREFNGKGMVQLLDWDEEKRILLLENISPGISLANIKENEEACRIAARVMKSLALPAPSETSIPTMEGRKRSLEKIMVEHPEGVGPISFPVLSKALTLFSDLLHTAGPSFVLHGDFHHFNVLLSGKEEWVAIDPKGLIGEIEYDLVQFLLNCLPEENLEVFTQKRVKIFTEELDLNEERLLQWGFCHAVLATAWSVDEDGGDSEGFYRMIEVFERLIGETGASF